MKYSSTISSKGQVTVPQEIRKRIGLSAGDRVEFVIENGQTLIRPVRGELNPFEKYKGVLKSFRSRKEINAWVSDMRDSETRDRRKNRDCEPRLTQMLCAGSGRGSHPRGRLNRRCLRLEVRVAWS